MHLRRCHLTPGVSGAAGRRVERGGRRHEAGARQCAYGRLVERQKHWGTRNGWRLGDVASPTGRSVLPGRSRPAHEPRQWCQLHALVGVQRKLFTAKALLAH